MRVRAQPEFVELDCPLVVQPGLDQVVGEDAALGEEGVVGLQLSSTASREPGTWGMAAASSGGSSYRSLSTGSGGSILFLIPSRPAISMAANARYGLQDGSGTRNSTRLAFGFVPVIGIRQQAERLR